MMAGVNCQYKLSTVLWCREKGADLPSDVVNALFFLEEFIHYGQMPRKVIYYDHVIHYEHEIM